MSLTQEMKDEGVSREVVNRIQKLKKKAKLVPTDEVTVFYDVPKGYLADVIKNHFDKIETSVRAKFIAGACPMFADEIGKIFCYDSFNLLISKYLKFQCTYKILNTNLTNIQLIRRKK